MIVFLQREQFALARCQPGLDRHSVRIQLIRDPVQRIFIDPRHAAGHQLTERRARKPAGGAALTARCDQSAHHLDLGQPTLPLREPAALQQLVAVQALPEHMRDVFRAEFANMLTAAALGIYLLGRSLALLLGAAALLFVADAFGKRRRQLVQVTRTERNQFLMIEQIFDALGQARPLGLGQIKGTEAQDEPLAGTLVGAYRLQKPVVGVGAAVAGHLELADEHGNSKDTVTARDRQELESTYHILHAVYNYNGRMPPFHPSRRLLFACITLETCSSPQNVLKLG